MKSNLQILILSLLLLLTGFSYSQENKLNIDLVAGASIPELYHAGVGFHYIPNASLSFNFGSDFKKNTNDRLYELTISYAYYFGKASPHVYQKLWSINSGFSFLIVNGIIEKSTVGYLNLFFARELPITKKIFIQPELGASYFIFEQFVNQENIVRTGYRTRVIPKFGLNLIVKV
jgi:hypothetical protein